MFKSNINDKDFGNIMRSFYSKYDKTDLPEIKDWNIEFGNINSIPKIIRKLLSIKYNCTTSYIEKALKY